MFNWLDKGLREKQNSHKCRASIVQYVTPFQSGDAKDSDDRKTSISSHYIAVHFNKIIFDTSPEKEMKFSRNSISAIITNHHL